MVDVALHAWLRHVRRRRVPHLARGYLAEMQVRRQARYVRIGRPVYYSDGHQSFAAHDLRHAGMLRWGTPQPEFALPGPVRGRVAQLPDGRLLYGRVTSARRTEPPHYGRGGAEERLSEVHEVSHEAAVVASCRG